MQAKKRKERCRKIGIFIELNAKKKMMILARKIDKLRVKNESNARALYRQVMNNSAKHWKKIG